MRTGSVFSVRFPSARMFPFKTTMPLVVTFPVLSIVSNGDAGATVWTTLRIWYWDVLLCRPPSSQP